MKIKRETSLKWNWKARSGSSHRHTGRHQLHEELSITGRIVNYRPQQKDHQKERITNYAAPTGKDAHYISYKKLTTPVTQPVKNHHHPELSLLSNGLSSK